MTKRRVDWPPHIREMVLGDLLLSHEAAKAAEDAFKIRVYMAVEQGVTTQQVADRLGISQSGASVYRRQGEALYLARRQAQE